LVTAVVLALAPDNLNRCAASSPATASIDVDRRRSRLGRSSVMFVNLGERSP
jgi:hypothetical protein